MNAPAHIPALDYGASSRAPIFAATDGPALHLGRFLAEPVYMVASYLGPRFGVASADATASFDEAVNRWAEHMADDGNAAVIKIDLASGTAQDVTREAERHYLKALRAARMADPDWMEAAE